MASSVIPEPSARAGNGSITAAATGAGPPTAEGRPDTARPPRSPLLAKLTSLTSIAAFAAVGLIIVGVLALVGGSYTKQVVHDQLAPQKIFFPPAGSPAHAARHQAVRRPAAARPARRRRRTPTTSSAST